MVSRVSVSDGVAKAVAEVVWQSKFSDSSLPYWCSTLALVVSQWRLVSLHGIFA